LTFAFTASLINRACGTAGVSVQRIKQTDEGDCAMKKFEFGARLVSFKRHPRLPLMFLAGMLAIATTLMLSASSAGRALERALSASAAQQSALSGQWIARFDTNRPAVINLMFSRQSGKGDSYTTSDDIARSELQGFPSDASSAAKVNVNFRIVREAGTFDCEGYFSAGKGAGFWTLTPNPNFISTMRARGYDNLTEEDLLRAALHNLTTKFIEDLKSVGYDRLEFRQLLRAASHEITPAYVRELQTAGYSGLSMDELIRARNHEIDSQYVKEVQAMGFDKQPLESLIRLKNHEITQAFINQMHAAGFDNLSIEELIRLKNHDITPEYVNGLKAEGYPDISVETAVRLKNHDIDRDFIRRAKARGFTNISLDQLIRLSSRDIVK
jgi:uncharacterized protein (UPF0335 family)